MPSRRYKLWSQLHSLFPPSQSYLHRLSKTDRPGLQITLPKPPLLEGREALERQDFQQALQHFDRCIEENPKNAWGWHGKGDAHQWLNDYKDACVAYEHACTLNPVEGLHWGGQANALLGLGERDRAFELRTQALTLNPTLHWMFKDWEQQSF